MLISIIDAVEHPQGIEVSSRTTVPLSLVTPIKSVRIFLKGKWDYASIDEDPLDPAACAREWFPSSR